MKTHHTPSPWTVERDGITLCMGGQIVATAIAPDGAGIEEQRANARLIAAAPHLLESVMGALAALSQNKTFQADIELARKYLNRAASKLVRT